MTVDKVRSLTAKGRIALYFSAPWCAPCRAFGPMLDALAKEHGFEVVKVDCERDPNVASEYLVGSVPTTLMFNNGSMVRQLVGARNQKKTVEELKLGGLVV